MAYAFYGARYLTIKAKDTPDLSNATSLEGMFAFAGKFNGDLSLWNTSSVTNMSKVFYGAEYFNGSIENWNTSKVTDMSEIFRNAYNFNQLIGSWDTSSVTNMSGMFFEAKTFNKDISSWDISLVDYLHQMFTGVTLSTDNYDALLISLDSKNTNKEISFDVGNSKYCSDESKIARTNLIKKKGWTITDGGACD